MGIEPRTQSKDHGEISAVWMPEGCHSVLPHLRPSGVRAPVTVLCTVTSLCLRAATRVARAGRRPPGADGGLTPAVKPLRSAPNMPQPLEPQCPLTCPAPPFLMR